MKNPPLKARQPAAGKNVERITLSLDGQDERALEKMADEKRVSIAPVTSSSGSTFDRMDDPQYVTGNDWKMQWYADNGFHEETNLFLSTETLASRIDSVKLEKLLV